MHPMSSFRPELVKEAESASAQHVGCATYPPRRAALHIPRIPALCLATYNPRQ